MARKQWEQSFFPSGQNAGAGGWGGGGGVFSPMVRISEKGSLYFLCPEWMSVPFDFVLRVLRAKAIRRLKRYQMTMGTEERRSVVEAATVSLGPCALERSTWS